LDWSAIRIRKALYDKKVDAVFTYPRHFSIEYWLREMQSGRRSIDVLLTLSAIIKKA
jgi:hypothetical protein